MYIPYTCSYGTIYRLQCVFSYAGSESVYGVDVEVVRHVAMATVRAGSSLYQENKLYHLKLIIVCFFW